MERNELLNGIILKKLNELLNNIYYHISEMYIIRWILTISQFFI